MFILLANIYIQYGPNTEPTHCTFSSLPLVTHHLSEVEHLEPQQKLLASMGTLKNSNTGAYRLSRS